MRNYWRIGVKYVDLEMFKRGYPYVWDVLDSDDLEILKEIQPGDIIVAGGIEKISFIGEVMERPVALFISQQPMPYIQCKIDVAGPATIEAFEPIESNYNDIVCIKTKWFAYASTGARQNTQAKFRWRSVHS